MNAPRRSDAPPSATDGAGVRVVERRDGRRSAAVWYKALALALVGVSATYLATRAMGDLGANAESAPVAIAAAGERGESERSDAADARSEAMATPRRDSATPAVEGDRDTSLDLADVVPPGEAPTMNEVIDRLHQAGIRSGLGAFSPPGTSPPLIGLAVPEDFVLPPGYVRHYQATDDGQRIEPILMFSPDFEFFDSVGRPIRIPENRVVPPELAPPGLALRPIEIPPPRASGTPTI